MQQLSQDVLFINSSKLTSITFLENSKWLKYFFSFLSTVFNTLLPTYCSIFHSWLIPNYPSASYKSVSLPCFSVTIHRSFSIYIQHTFQWSLSYFLKTVIWWFPSIYDIMFCRLHSMKPYTMFFRLTHHRDLSSVSTVHIPLHISICLLISCYLSYTINKIYNIVI